MTDHKDKIHIDHGRMHEALAAGHGALASRITEAKRHMEAYELAWASAFERDVLSGGDHTRGYPKTERGRRRLAADRLGHLELVGATGWCEFDDAPAWSDDHHERRDGVRRCLACQTTDRLIAAMEADQ